MDSPEVIVNRPLDAQYGSEILYETYRFSQGDASIQAEIFMYLDHIRPNWRISDELMVDIKNAVLYPVRELTQQDTAIRQHPGQSNKKIHASLDREIGQMRNVLNTDGRWFADKDNFLFGLMFRILQRDFHFLRNPTGRLRGDAANDPNEPSQDPWLSHFQHYLLSATPTGYPEFDQMFADMKKLYEESRGAKHAYYGYNINQLNDELFECESLWQ